MEEECKGRRRQITVGRQIRLSAPGHDEAIRWRELTEIIRALSRLESVDHLLQYFLTATLELLEADRGEVRLLNETSKQFELFAQHGFDDLPDRELALLRDNPVHHRVRRVHGRVLIEDIKESPWWGDHASRSVLLGIGCRSMQTTPLIRSSGRILGLVTTCNDMPGKPTALQMRLLDSLCLQVAGLLERARERETLLDSAQRKDDFLATLAHELRNAIAPLRSSLEILKLAQLEHPLHARARAILDRRLDHTTRLLDDLMDASRIARGKLQLRSERIPLAGVLESALEIATPVITEAEHELTTTLPDRDVFVNLLQNAAKYTPGGGHIHLSAVPDAGGARVEIRDNGIGIAAEALPHVFEMFSQATSAEQRSQGGLGIGLALVKGIVDMHGGTVQVASAGRNRGSTFTVWLATVSSRERAQPIADFPRQSGGMARLPGI
jgi:signal transduction histidine kinase